MTAIDELLREVLDADAQTHTPTADLPRRCLASGRRLRRRRQAGLVSLSLLSVAGIVAGAVALASSSGNHSRRQIITPGHQASASVGSHHANRGSQPKRSTRAWTSWPTDRVFGAKPASGFFHPSSRQEVFATGTMTDNTDFVVYGDPKDGNSAAYLQGWNGVGDFGQSAGEGPGGAQSAYLTAESPTYAAHQNGGPARQWLIVVGRPGTVSASYSADGVNWQRMQVQHGIAVINLPGIAPRASQIRLSDANGQYVEGPLALP